MGIPKRMAVAVSGLAFTGGAALVLALAPAAGAEAAVTAPDQAISGGNVFGGGGGGGGGGRPGGRPGGYARRAVIVHRPQHVMHRRVSIHRSIIRPQIHQIHRPCVSCHNHDRFSEHDHQNVRMHKRVIVVNRNRNLSESDAEQFQHGRGHQFMTPERRFREMEPQDG
ncbi:MAG TPA: hypothetical protein VGP70_23205 [Actinomadura sp.]|jgi:hypothetical protein|nr:hypothetical protein [Actinomadura sp.]